MENAALSAPTLAKGGLPKGKRRGHDLKRVTRTLATGERRTYLYHRPSGRRIESEPGTPEFLAEVASYAQGAGFKPGRIVEGVSYVYFIRSTATGAIKIGKSQNPFRRHQILQVGSPDKLEMLGWIRFLVGEPAERNIAGRFNEHRIRGEWFRPAPDLLDFIASKASMG